MSVTNLKLDDLPIVHAAYIYSTIFDNEPPIILGDSECASIAKGLKKSEGKSLTQLANEYSTKPLRTRKTFEINDECYELYVLHATADDKAVFIVEGDTLFTNTLKLKEEKENSLLILPFLDGALTRFLERAQIYGANAMPKNQDNSHKRLKSMRSKRILTMRETFSLEEVFRELDVDGNGSIDLEEWKHGLTTMMGSSSITDNDLELVFNTISDNGAEIKWRQFYGFFDGKKLTSRRNRTLSSQLILTANFANSKHLGTLNETEQEEEDKISDDQKDQKEKECEHIQKVKQTIKDCLNLGEDNILLSGGTPYTPSTASGYTPLSDNNNNGVFNQSGASLLSLSNIPSNSSATGSIINGNIDVDNMDVSKSLLRIESNEDLLDILESNLYQIPDQITMTKWENRYQSHKLRINNFRKILNGMLSSKIISMKDENETLLKQLEVIRESNDSSNALQGMADLHNQHLSSLVSPKKSGLRKGSKRDMMKKGGRSHKSMRSGSFSNSDDDSSSVDSEVNLVYTKGTKLSSKESETLINRVKLQKKEIKKLSKGYKKLKEEHKLEIVKLRAVIDTKNTKLKSYEKARQSMVGKQQNIQQQMRKLKASRSSAMKLQSNKDQSAQSQREISVLKKQLKNLSNELEAEQERKRNLQKKLTRVISSNNRESEKNSGNNGISMNKLKRLEKEKEKLDQECQAKTKKMDEMFLKLGKKERKCTKLDEENADLKAKLGSYNTQIKEINKRTMELQNVTDDRDRALAEIEILHKKLVKLNEKIAKLKNRNKKMKDRIKNLLLTIEEYDKLATHSRKLINDLSALQRELNSVEQESMKYKNENETLNNKIAELKKRIFSKKQELDTTSVKLEKFRDDLSAEYSVIRSLQEQIEEKESLMNEMEEEHQKELEQHNDRNLSEKELLENKNEDLSMELIRSKAQVEQSEKIINRYKEKCEKYQKQIEELNEKLINYEQNQLMKLNSSITDLQNQIYGKDDEIKLLKQKNDELTNDLNAAKDISDAIKDKNDEIDDLMNKIEALQTKLSGHQEKYKNKCNQYDELLNKYKKLEKETLDKQNKIKKLNIKIKDYSTAKMEREDDTKLKLKQYNVQIITIEENKKLIEKLRKDVGEYRTKWELEKEALERHKKATGSLEEDCEEKDKLIKTQKKKIKSLQKELDTSGYGDSKQKSTLSLLRKNVDEMESIIRSKDFEIKKLRNNMKAMGIGTNMNNNNNSNHSVELKKKIKENESLSNKNEKLKTSNKKYKESVKANKELLTTKNDEISKLKIEISELKEFKSKMVEEQKENESLNKELSESKNKTNVEVEKLNDKIQELQDNIMKIEQDKQRKIDKLESELAEKDSVLAHISKQVGTEFHNSQEIDINQ